MTFGMLKIGTTFFDPFSGEFWVKVSESKARILTGFDIHGLDQFSENEEVVV